MRPRPASAIPQLASSIEARYGVRLRLLHGLPNPCEHPARFRLTNASRPYASIPSVRGPRPRGGNFTKEEDTTENESAGRKPGPMIWASCLFGFGLSLYLSFLYASYTRAVKATARLDLPQNADVSDRWRDTARNYDDEVNLSETLMLQRAKRRRLVNQAYGNVLEVSVGTGRNMDLYDLRPFDPKEDETTGRSRKRIISSLTFNDQSDVMVMHAERKFEEMEGKRKKGERFTGPVHFIVGDAGVKGVIKRPEGGYDTIVQTMGVCSMSDAAGFLRRLGELCRQPGEASSQPQLSNDDGRGGRILLLEHGRGYFGWLNRLLDNGAKMHAAHYGCWWNKDIGQVIKESGLVVERMRRYHFGTTWEIVLRPPGRTEVVKG